MTLADGAAVYTGYSGSSIKNNILFNSPGNGVSQWQNTRSGHGVYYDTDGAVSLLSSFFLFFFLSFFRFLALVILHKIILLYYSNTIYAISSFLLFIIFFTCFFRIPILQRIMFSLNLVVV